MGLGNPGPEYAGSRHNAGFLVAEELGRRGDGGARWKKRQDGLLAEAQFGDRSLWLLRPLTFMNLSGRCVGRVARRLEVPPERLLVVHDEVDLEFGQLKVKLGGGHAGHKGVRSVIEAMGSRDFARVRVGVGRPTGDTADWVLEEFSRAERAGLGEVIGRAADAVQAVVAEGVTGAMNRFNTRRRDA